MRLITNVLTYPTVDLIQWLALSSYLELALLLFSPKYVAVMPLKFVAGTGSGWPKSFKEIFIILVIYQGDFLQGVTLP